MAAREASAMTVDSTAAGTAIGIATLCLLYARGWLGGALIYVGLPAAFWGAVAFWVWRALH